MTFKNGLNAPKENYGKGYKFINVLDIIKNDFLNHDNIVGLVDVSEKDFKKNIVEYGDILFQRSSETREEVGQANVYLDKDRFSTFGGFVIRGKKNAEYAPVFLNYLLKTDGARKEITSKSGGSTRYNVGQDTLSSVKIILPLLEEQSKIASFLTSIEERISTQSKIIENLESLLRGYTQRLFSKQIRFNDNNGDEFPDWEFKNGNILFKNISDKNHKSDLPILAITQDKGAIPRDMIDYNIGVTSKSVSSYKIVKKGDFIISLRSFQGGIEYSNYTGICSPAYIILRPEKILNKDFYKFYLKTPTYITELNKRLEGIRDGKMISYKYFSEIKLPLPSLKEQTKIANFLSAYDNKIETEKLLLEQLKQQKQYFLQNMFV